MTVQRQCLIREAGQFPDTEFPVRKHSQNRPAARDAQIERHFDRKIPINDMIPDSDMPRSHGTHDSTRPAATPGGKPTRPRQGRHRRKSASEPSCKSYFRFALLHVRDFLDNLPQCFFRIRTNTQPRRKHAFAALRHRRASTD